MIQIRAEAIGPRAQFILDLLSHIDTLDHVHGQIDKLGQYLMEHFPSDIYGGNHGAVDVALVLLDELKTRRTSGGRDATISAVARDGRSDSSAWSTCAVALRAGNRSTGKEDQVIQQLMDFVDRMTNRYGGTVYDIESGRDWDWGQAFCRECWGSDPARWPDEPSVENGRNGRGGRCDLKGDIGHERATGRHRGEDREAWTASRYSSWGKHLRLSRH
jgi:hypothetical protein